MVSSVNAPPPPHHERQRIPRHELDCRAPPTYRRHHVEDNVIAGIRIVRVGTCAQVIREGHQPLSPARRWDRRTWDQTAGYLASAKVTDTRREMRAAPSPRQRPVASFHPANERINGIDANWDVLTNNSTSPSLNGTAALAGPKQGTWGGENAVPTAVFRDRLANTVFGDACDRVDRLETSSTDSAATADRTAKFVLNDGRVDDLHQVETLSNETGPMDGSRGQANGTAKGRPSPNLEASRLVVGTAPSKL